MTMFSSSIVLVKLVTEQCPDKMLDILPNFENVCLIILTIQCNLPSWAWTVIKAQLHLHQQQKPLYDS